MAHKAGTGNSDLHRKLINNKARIAAGEELKPNWADPPNADELKWYENDLVRLLPDFHETACRV